MSELSLLRDVRELIKYVYSIELVPDEKFGLQSQLRRAAVSVALNIREGNVFDNANKKRFFKIALGSLCETDECLSIIFEMGLGKRNGECLFIEEYKLFHDKHYWLCLNKLKKLITSINSGDKK